MVNPESVRLLLASLSLISLPPPDLQALSEQLHRDPVRLTLADMALDSLGRLEFCISLEVEHGVIVTPETLAPLQDAAQLLRCLDSAPRV